MALDRLFGELRACLQNRAAPEVLLDVLQVAHRQNPQQYHHQWLPYLQGFSLPPFEVATLEQLASIDRLLPAGCVGMLKTPQGAWSEESFGDRGMAQLARMPALSRLTGLSLPSQYIHDLGISSLLNSDYLQPLRLLELSNNSIGAQSIEMMARHPSMRLLQHLGLGYTRITDASLCDLLTHTVAPLESLLVNGTGLGEAFIERLVTSPWVASLTLLDLTRTHLDEACLEHLCKTRWRLEQLRLGCLDLSSAGMHVLSRTKSFESLRVLDLWGNDLSHESIELLAKITSLPSLRALDVSDNDIGRGFGALVTSEHFAQLRHLKVATNYLWSELMLPARQATCARLESLDLQENVLTHTGLEHLLAASWTPHLRKLNLWDNDLGDDGCEVFAQCASLRNLGDLNLNENNITDHGVARLLQAPWLSSLVTLNLQYNAIGDEGAQRIASSEAFKNLKVLSLYGCPLTDEGARVLANSPGLSSLRVLDLGLTEVSQEGLIALANSPYLRAGTVIKLEETLAHEELYVIDGTTSEYTSNDV